MWLDRRAKCVSVALATLLTQNVISGITVKVEQNEAKGDTYDTLSGLNTNVSLRVVGIAA